MIKKIKKIVALTTAVLVLSGCSAINQFFNGQQQSAPVTNIPTQQTYYTVQISDSLYDISRRFNVTERTLILWNKLKSPYVLTPGSTIRVGPLPGEKIRRDGQMYTYQGGVLVPVGTNKPVANTSSIGTGSKVSAVSESTSVSNQHANNIPVIDPDAAPVAQSQSVQSAPVAATAQDKVINQDKELDMHDLAQNDDNVGVVIHHIAKSKTGFYTVQSGDSLLEIAVANNVSLADLQAWNDIKEPSMIYVGEKLRVATPEQHSSAEQKTVAVKSMTHESVTKAKPVKAETVDVNKENKATETKAAKSPVATVATPAVAEKTKTKPIVTKASLPNGKTVAGISWQWPLKESGKFDKDGIDQQREIDVPQGTEVYAAATGSVLYAGVGMGGYGQMVIVSHKDGYISAYNNLSSISVKESQDVTQGELLGAVGKFNGASALGFEIRQNGNVEKLSQFYAF
ncbi:LysM peptidoglycan-binding domain-containing protein [Cysteiniphilum sp. QT6929]|uniref:LysM peptidoglycan-binding domain-containing protein n=1 Tax=Cysteiniphilum sp. QT6929 TaxID=2975055 RepID=UPI0024B3B900|nr:LysM peptidoglycan-binding domain-containing protein [Cysteiniphilum sp. QT6929]WHN65733.1 LysM peptidoglycan-binding domain-containing protein [Cysteiniphilum sp. QT6929]